MTSILVDVIIRVRIDEWDISELGEWVAAHLAAEHARQNWGSDSGRYLQHYSRYPA